MRAQLTKTALTAGIALAMAFTLSCSSDKDDGGGEPSPNASSPSVGSSSSGVNLGGSSSSGGSGGSDIANYRTKQIGTQVWMAENLNYDVSGNNTDVCYGNDPTNCATYGRLYDWATAMALPSSCNTSSCSSQITAKHRGICPAGWHIPSDADWNVLMKFVNPGCSDNSSCANAGTKLKATSGWNTGSGYKAGTDEHGFSALPGGSYSNGNFDYVGNYGYWWSASENASIYAYGRNMRYYLEDVSYFGLYVKSDLFSVRCLKDEVH